MAARRSAGRGRGRARADGWRELLLREEAQQEGEGGEEGEGEWWCILFCSQDLTRYTGCLRCTTSSSVGVRMGR